MPGFEIRDLYQAAVYWPVIGRDGFGEPVVSLTPQEIRVRWLDVFEQVQDPQGNLITIHAKVTVGLLTIGIGSRLWQGTLADWLTGSSAQPSDLTVGISWNKTPDIKNRNQRRELGLMRHKDSNTPAQ
jgi:hypothetical protein